MAMRTYLLAIVIGVAVGALGSAFHCCLETVPDLYIKVASLLSGDAMSPVLVTALLGAAMVALAFVLVRRFAPETAGSGIQEIEGAMAGLRPPVRWRRVIPVKFVGGVLAMGSGLVLGREGPTIHLGGCIGALIGIFSAGFNTVMLACLRFSDRLGRGTMLIIAASVGALAGTLMVMAPEFVGGGEALVKQLFSTSPTLGFLLVILLVRALLTFLSYSVGVPGGIFAPMLALGTVAGLSFGYVAQDIFPNLELHSGAFAIAAMGVAYGGKSGLPNTVTRNSE